MNEWARLEVWKIIIGMWESVCVRSTVLYFNGKLGLDGCIWVQLRRKGPLKSETYHNVKHAFRCDTQGGVKWVDGLVATGLLYSGVGL